MSSAPRVSQGGQAAVEYLVGALLVMALLFLPIAGYPSALAWFLATIQLAFQDFLAALSLP
jgi:hypothetical protein